VHYIDFSGEFFSVKGPSITPRPPQAHPPVVLHLGDGSDEADAVAVIGRWADVVRVAAPDLAASAAARQRVRAAVAAAGRDPDVVPVLLDVETLLAATAGDAARTLEQLDGWAGATGPAAAPGTLRAVGTPDELAELIGDAVGGGAADGVTLAPLALPAGLRVITGELVPALVARGLRPAAPRPGSLRDRFGLPRPANYFTEARA
jgi:alkanesulfonate monooxygenase SsuD/methylene tetrahydromethanopterin reductase-like flavin-dependent oxidoreductase (luciferase family)